MGMPVLGRCELASASTGRAQAGPDAGGVWDTARRQTATADLSAQPGRKPERLGRAAGRSVSPRAARRELAVDPDRWLRGIGSRDSDGLSASTASALLGAQDAQYPGEGAETRL